MVGLLTPCSVPRGGFLYTIIVPGGGICSIQVVSCCERVADNVDLLQMLWPCFPEEGGGAYAQ